MIFLILLVSVGCDRPNKDSYFDLSQDASGARTAPSPELEIQKNYINPGSSTNGMELTSRSTSTTRGGGTPASADVEYMVGKYQENTKNFQQVGEAVNEYESSDTVSSVWDSGKTYAKPGSKVKYKGTNDRIGIFVNKWWSKNNPPSFGANGPWKLIKRINGNGKVLTVKEATEAWDSDTVYTGGSLAKHTINNKAYCFRAKYWTKGNTPILTGEGTGKKSWDSPWKVDKNACNSTDPAVSPVQVGGGKPVAEQPPKAEAPAPSQTPVSTTPDNTPIVPPVIPKPPILEDVVEFEPSPMPPAGSVLPADGYAFLRKVTTTHWDWLFPLRSGKYNPLGSYRNQPPLAAEDGSKDTFNLDNFKKAVLSYNNWAKKLGYKQFLNEGTKKQQAQEFLVFWAKSSRETSGTWSTAKSPWIEQYKGTDVWKGGLYWVEEVGYKTNSAGISTSINYVDTASSYTPFSGRSYYGRGVIQLSWNYNYGAFSEWLYTNGMLPDLITAKDTLLKRPDYVALKGDLSILSGIWFWMTPQGTKPSSHDVLYGDVYNISADSWDPGLPPMNDKGGGTIPVAAGDTTDESVMAYRLGTIINIVNGGIECNGAAKYHTGPPQRVSYFNAYTMYFNDQMPGLNATRVTKATNIWKKHVGPGDDNDIKNATCYSQKSYYGW